MPWLDGAQLDSPAAQVFATLLVAVLFVRLCRYMLAMFGLG